MFSLNDHFNNSHEEFSSTQKIINSNKNNDCKEENISENNFNINNTIDLDIEDYSSQDIYDFLNFIYTADMPSRDVNKLISLCELADKYCVQSLKNYCEPELVMIEEVTKINLDNLLI